MVEQVGGDHYAQEYPHWDWVRDMGLDYLIGNATKYVARYKRKGTPVQDLEKAISYIEKWREAPVYPSGPVKHGCIEGFVKQCENTQQRGVLKMLGAARSLATVLCARDMITALIRAETDGQGSPGDGAHYE